MTSLSSVASSRLASNGLGFPCWKIRSSVPLFNSRTFSQESSAARTAQAREKKITRGNRIALLYWKRMSRPARVLSNGSLEISRTQQRLLDAAREVFARDGISRATTREIARVAGVNEVTLFRQFATKDNLLAAALEDAIHDYAAALAAINLEILDLDRDLRQFARSYV